MEEAVVEQEADEDGARRADLDRTGEPSSSSSEELPRAVTLLRTPDGLADVYLVGTAHYSNASCQDVDAVIRRVQPELVVLELDQTRISLLNVSNADLDAHASEISFSELRRAISEGRGLVGVLHHVLASYSYKITRDLGIVTGAEFRAAVAAARDVPGCKVVLGDRPIQVTLRRTMMLLSWWQRARLFFHLVTTPLDGITQEDIEKFKEQDVITEALSELAAEFPGVEQALITERDQYLACTLRSVHRMLPKVRRGRTRTISDSLTLSPSSLSRSPSGQSPRPLSEADSDRDADEEAPQVRVVGVVGMGHVQGIVAHWGEVIDMRELMRTTAPVQALWKRVAWTTCKWVVVGTIAFYAGRRILRRFR